MEITETRIKLVENRQDRLKAFCSITIDDDFVIRDLKIIEGTNGYFVAMPSRKITDRCPTCKTKNHLRAKFCNECGKRLHNSRPDRQNAHLKLHADIAHPINASCREKIQNLVIEAYESELKKSQQPGYVPPKMDVDDDYFVTHHPGGNTSPPQEKSSENSEQQQVDNPYTQSDESEKKHSGNGFSEGII